MAKDHLEKPGMSGAEYQNAMLRKYSGNGFLSERVAAIISNLRTNLPDAGVIENGPKEDSERALLSPVEQLQKHYDDSFDYILSAIPPEGDFSEDCKILNEMREYKERHVRWIKNESRMEDFKFPVNHGETGFCLMLKDGSDPPGMWYFHRDKGDMDVLEIVNTPVSRLWAGLNMIGAVAEHYLHQQDMPKAGTRESLLMRMLEIRLRIKAMDTLSGGRYVRYMEDYLRQNHIGNLYSLSKLLERTGLKTVRKAMDGIVAKGDPCLGKFERRLRDAGYVKGIALTLINYTGPLTPDEELINKFQQFLEIQKMSY